MKPIIVCLSATLLLPACGKDKSGSGEAPGTEPAPAATDPAQFATSVEPPAAPAGDAATAGGEAAGGEAASLDVKDIGLATPESVLYDDADDVYLVSNINGNPPEADDNGFISRVDPDGKVRELKWIDGARPDVKLNAPKGMAFLGDTLYVSDITVVRMFDRRTGASRGEVAIKGSTFLNDVVASGDAVYVSDSGLKPDFKPSGTDAVHKIDGSGKATPLIKSKKLGNPNGLAAAEDGLWVVTFGSGEIYSVGADGKKQAGAKLPKGQLDGIVALDGGTLLVSSWEAKVVYKGDGKEWKELVTDVESPADIGYDSKRKRLVIPLFMGNGLAIRPVE